MANWLHILADSDDVPFKGLVFVVFLILWGISALSKAMKSGSQQQKEKMRKVREAIEQSQAAARQQAPRQAGRPPVQLAPEIQRRVPPPVVTRPRQQAPRKMMRRPVPPQAKRAATNYNVMAAKKTRPAPPPLPAATATAAPEVQLISESAPPTPSVVSRKAIGVSAATISQWLKPATLQQQFMLTEIFQPPLALRGER